MAEEQAQATETAAQEVDATATPETETDWQQKYEAMRAHSRDWEKRAKENAAAATELEQLKQQQMSEQEKANARAEKAEAELAAMKAEAERATAARKLADETGVPVELLEYCQDEEAMQEFARVYQLKQQPVHAAGKANTSKVVVGGDGKVSNGDLFAETAKQFFK